MDLSSSELPSGCGKAKQSGGLPAPGDGCIRHVGDSYDENIAMAKDRAARSRHLGERRSHGLEPRALSDAYGWIDLGIYGGPVQRGRCQRRCKIPQKRRLKIPQAW